MLCLQLLRTASAAGPMVLERFHKYRVFAEDLRPFLMERAKVAADKALKSLHRSPYRRPPSTSNITLGARPRDN